MEKQLIQAMHLVLADTYALYLKTQNYHWNVTGPEFKSLHLLFEEQYNDLATAIDELAERIRMLNSKVTASLQKFNQDKTIEDADHTFAAEKMVSDLAHDQQKIIKTLHAALRLAQAANDEVTTGMLTERISQHEKNQWMLSSSI